MFSYQAGYKVIEICTAPLIYKMQLKVFYKVNIENTIVLDKPALSTNCHSKLPFPRRFFLLSCSQDLHPPLC